MNTSTDSVWSVDYSNKNLRNTSFQNENLVNTSFRGSDLRGADFSGANLTGADLKQVKTGITPFKTGVIFFITLVVSMLSGYIAMLAGNTIQEMLKSGDVKIKVAGIVSIILIVTFIIYFYFKGGRSVIRNLLLPAFLISIVIGGIAYFSGLGTGKGMLFLCLALLMVVVLIAIGTIARALAGVLSSFILFILVSATGSVFGSRIGGGISATIMAVSCVVITRRALGGGKGFESLRRLASLITRKFGTSFQGANLANASFSGSTIQNADFTDADLSSVNWGDSKKENCTP